MEQNLHFGCLWVNVTSVQEQGEAVAKIPNMSAQNNRLTVMGSCLQLQTHTCCKDADGFQLFYVHQLWTVFTWSMLFAEGPILYFVHYYYILNWIFCRHTKYHPLYTFSALAAQNSLPLWCHKYVCSWSWLWCLSLPCGFSSGAGLPLNL